MAAKSGKYLVESASDFAEAGHCRQVSNMMTPAQSLRSSPEFTIGLIQLGNDLGWKLRAVLNDPL